VSYREALALAEEAGDPQLLFPCYDGLATLFLDIGDDAREEEYMARGSRSASGPAWSLTHWRCCRSSDDASRRPTA